MAQQKIGKPTRNLERLFLAAIGLVLGYLFIHLFDVLKKDFPEADKRLGDGTMVNVNDPNPAPRIKAMLEKGYYYEDARDVQLIANVLSETLHPEEEQMDNIGELNKQAYYVDANRAMKQGGTSFQKRVKLSRALIGFTGADSIRFEQEQNAPPSLPATNSLAMGLYNIEGSINNEEGKAVPNALVRLQLILPQDSVYSSSITDIQSTETEQSNSVIKTYAKDSLGNRQLQTLMAYARTDAKGDFAFSGLPEGKAFEVLPLQPGYQFGASKGVQDLTEDVSFSFVQSLHKIRLFSSRDFSILKKEQSLVVRTPKDFTEGYWLIVAVFFICFLLLHLLLSFKFREADQIILPVVMLLTGLSFLTLLSLQDSLRDRFLAHSTLIYFCIGIVFLIVILFFDLRRFTTDALFYRLGVFKDKSAARGWPWAAAALLLLLATIIFGTGPEGSGVHVNLFGFQPSEVVKFLIIIFLAGFFSLNEKFISQYRSWNKRWAFFYVALAAIIATILLFLVQGDLGPAIVCCFTFIILFSFSRGDFFYMTATVVFYVLALWLIKNVWLATGITALAVLLSSLFLRRTGVSESAIMALVVIASFLLLDQIPFLDKVIPGPVHRLVDRKAIWQDPWNNEVFGGDQVANGIWAMATGGIPGQGIGEGFAKTIPEAHTDMILPSMGEEFGWDGIICIFILFLIFLHRAIIIGRQTGRPFLFYLCAGIGVCTFVQFLLIAGGSTGALPLSGVSLPFVSYGGSSLIINLLAAGFLLSSSLVRGSAVQMEFITKQQDKNLMPALLSATIGIILLSVNVSKYLFHNAKWVVQPALVADRSGARMFSYNPRIAILMNRLQAGTLFDRKGNILATSNPSLVQQQQDSLVAAGLQRTNLESIQHRRLDRYYPFGEQMFFWTGDANTGIFTGGTNGYFAEYQHGPELRGFKTPSVAYTVTASRFKEDRFLPQTEEEMTVVKRDYSALSPLLLAGIYSDEVEAFKKQNRDVVLAVDGRLQTALQQALQADDKIKDKRVSIVVMADSTGDVLASAAYPLPDINNWDELNLSLREQNKLEGWVTNSDIGFTYATQPGSTAKILTAMAAFNKLGLAAAKKTFVIHPQDLIRIHSDEPDETGTINLERAIVKSNNSYFIKLANEEQLQEQMATLYMQTGMFLRGVGGYFYENDTNNTEQQNAWRALWRKTEFTSLRRYDKNNIRATRGLGISGMAWGQGELIATPTSVARLAASVAHEGVLMPNRYVLKISDSSLAVGKGVRLAADPQYAQLLTSYMKEQSANKVDRLGIKVAGKTGTPERIWKGKRINDGWYVFFAPKASGAGHIVVCIRIEATKGSSDAVKLAGEDVIPILKKEGYIKGFDEITNKKQ